MKPISVPLKKDAYHIHFGPVFKELPVFLKKRGLGPNVFLVAPRALSRNKTVARMGKALKKKGFAVSLGIIPDGEKFKNQKTLFSLFGAAARARVDRRSVVLAMGGGVTTDLAGFFAASYMRGIPYVSVPTTVLGMVDAAVGGKTGIDLPEGKNLVGAFWQPKAVWVDADLLRTLPDREWKTGSAEIIKYGVIKDAPFFNKLEDGFRKFGPLRRWPRKNLLAAVRRSVEIKAQVVSRDVGEKPLGGGREILNFGHTFGHALEAATVYGKVTHGEAISMGMAAVGHLALLSGLWSPGEQMRLLTLLERAGLPIHAPSLRSGEIKKFWTALSLDKKNVGGKLRFVLPVKMGKVIVKSGLPLSRVQRAWRVIRKPDF